jgi:hypothetical protein
VVELKALRKATKQIEEHKGQLTSKYKEFVKCEECKEIVGKDGDRECDKCCKRWCDTCVYGQLETCAVCYRK